MGTKLKGPAHHTKTLARIAPVGLALSPIGLLFGVLAAQAGWGSPEVVLMALLGFSGSGQFAYLGFTHPDNQQVEYLTIFLIILGINLRYIPMSLSASASIPGGPFTRALLAHWLADESYAVERVTDGRREKTIIRLTIVCAWTLSTLCGVLLAGILPAAADEILHGLTFPISGILILLSWNNISTFIRSQNVAQRLPHSRRLRSVLLCVVVSLACILLIGPEYFWIPGIAAGYLALNLRDGAGDE